MKFTNYSHYTQPEDLKRLRFVLETIQNLKIKSPKILDIGCGNGNISYQLAMSGCNVTGIDISVDAIAYANQHFKHEKAEYKVFSVYDLPDDNSFDVIICSEVLEHLPVPENMLFKTKKLLSENGIVIVTVPNGKGPREVLVTKPVQNIKNSEGVLWKLIVTIKKLLGYKQTSIQSASLFLDHVQFFSLSDLKNLFKSTGFELENIQAGNFLEKAFPFSIITRFCKPLQQFDCWLANRIPLSFASGFMTVIKPRNQ